METYPGRLELPLTLTIFHGLKPVQATEVRLYLGHISYFSDISDYWHLKVNFL